MSTRLEAGDYVYVTGGPGASSNGRIDFIDRDGARALVDMGAGRKGGLTWIALAHCYCHGKPNGGRESTPEINE
jgi:hypothetical protein